TILAMAVVGIGYTVLGGITAVVWTDAVQMFTLWLGAILSVIILITSIDGGLSEILSVASEANYLDAINTSFSPNVEYSIWAGVFGGVFLHAAYFGADQSQIQRVLTSKSIKRSQMSLILGGFVMFPQMLLFMFIGILLYVFYRQQGGAPTDNLNELFPTFVVQNLPAGVSGLIIAGVFAAAMSSLDSGLNSLAAATVRDIYS